MDYLSHKQIKARRNPDHSVSLLLPAPPWDFRVDPATAADIARCLLRECWDTAGTSKAVVFRLGPAAFPMTQEDAIETALAILREAFAARRVVAPVLLVACPSAPGKEVGNG